MKKDNEGRTKLYSLWYSLKERCYNPKNMYYYNYGSKDIEVCDEWRESFDNFYTWFKSFGIDESKMGIGKGLYNLFRFDIKGDYTPDNTTIGIRYINSPLANNSGYIGVTTSKNKYRGTVTIKDKRRKKSKNVHSKLYETKLEAMMAYDAYIDKHKLEYEKNNLSKPDIVILDTLLLTPVTFREDFLISIVMTHILNNTFLQGGLLKRSELTSSDIDRFKLAAKEIKRDHIIEDSYVVVERSYPNLILNIHKMLQ